MIAPARPIGTVHAAGAVLWRPRTGGGPDQGPVEVAVVHRPHHGDWSLPKGKVDPGETRVDAAVREVAEETGFDAVLGRHLQTVCYPVGPDRKVVDYWSARAGTGTFTPGGETDELRWLAPGEAAELVSYDADRSVLSTFTACPPRLATLLLVRHGSAGKRAEWPGRDTERPLDERGRRQARRLTGLLARFGVDTLHAVGKTRCIDTLTPFALAQGLRVTREPTFADGAVERDPAAARARLEEIVAGRSSAAAPQPPVAAVCAQGDGIPTLVRDLAAASMAAGLEVPANRSLDDPPCRKGSVWVLSFVVDEAADAPRLACADYYRDAEF